MIFTNPQHLIRPYTQGGLRVQGSWLLHPHATHPSVAIAAPQDEFHHALSNPAALRPRASPVDPLEERGLEAFLNVDPPSFFSAGRLERLAAGNPVHSAIVDWSRPLSPTRKIAEEIKCHGIPESTPSRALIVLHTHNADARRHSLILTRYGDITADEGRKGDMMFPKILRFDYWLAPGSPAQARWQYYSRNNHEVQGMGLAKEIFLNWLRILAWYFPDATVTALTDVQAFVLFNAQLDHVRVNVGGEMRVEIVRTLYAQGFLLDDEVDALEGGKFSQRMFWDIVERKFDEAKRRGATSVETSSAYFAERLTSIAQAFMGGPSLGLELVGTVRPYQAYP